jgi:multimeric flavodoxin WrbA
LISRQAKKIIGLACGRKNGNSEILLKEALMSAEELGLGINTEIIRAMDLDIRPCRGCQACGGPGDLAKKCVIKDDVEWILNKTLLEDAALIISFPAYHLQINGHLKMITDRMNPVVIKNIQVLDRTRVGALICVGGSGSDWTSMALSSAHIYLQHSRVLVDQMQVNYAPWAGDVLAMDNIMERARDLGRNVARSILLPIEKVKYLGPQNDMECPVCHCNLFQIPDGSPYIYCAVCWVQGTLINDGPRLKVKWNPEDVKYPRFSKEAHFKHFEEQEGTVREFIEKNKDKYDRKAELLQKYIHYGNMVKP